MQVSGICSHFLEMKDARKAFFGIFVYDLPGAWKSGDWWPAFTNSSNLGSDRVMVDPA